MSAKEVAAAVAAERERIRLAILGCVTCGKVHEYRPVHVNHPACNHSPPCGMFSTWASPEDGHAYVQPWRPDGAEDTGDFLRRVLS